MQVRARQAANIAKAFVASQLHRPLAPVGKRVTSEPNPFYS